jgi:hypothetical protein
VTFALFVAEARNWIAYEGPDRGDDPWEWDDDEVCAVIERTYDGGWAQFVKDKLRRTA